MVSGPCNLWNLLAEAPQGLVAGRRSVPAFGLPFEVLWIPSRGRREGVPRGGRPCFAKSRGPRIRREEALWEGEEAVLTPNRFPFAAQHGLFWPREGHPREWPLGFLKECFAIVMGQGGTLLGNSVGASASIPLCHLHLFPNESPVWPQMEFESLGELEVEGERMSVGVPSPSFPLLVVKIWGGSPEARASLCRELLDRRMTASVNIGVSKEATFLFPRREETPSPYYDHALGGMELFGCFVFHDEEGFACARGEALEGALRQALPSQGEAEIQSLRGVMGELGEGGS